MSGLDSVQSNQMQISSSMGLANPNINLNSTTMANDSTNHVSQSNSVHLQQQPLPSPTSPQHQSSHQTQQASNSHHQMTQNSQTQHGPQTPNTPTSIPEIIFTDFSGTSELTKGKCCKSLICSNHLQTQRDKLLNITTTSLT